jgi:hypothetical protein
MVFHNDEYPHHDKTEVLYGIDIIIKKSLDLFMDEGKHGRFY